MTKVLYCGMADDILMPLLLIPDLLTLFVIDKFDLAFARHETWEGQKGDIIQILVDGNNKSSWHREEYLAYKKTASIYSIDAPCTILSKTDDGNIWTLEFEYMDMLLKIYKYIYFYM